MQGASCFPDVIGRRHISNTDSQRRLVAVLLNPPEGNGERTNARLRVARDALRCDVVEVVNLYPRASKGLTELGQRAHRSQDWLQHREMIAMALQRGDEVLLGWGVSLPSGRARALMIAQVRWVTDLLCSIGIVPWVVGDGPRHPSRWHQYLSDRHGRTSGGSFEARVREALVPCDPSVPSSVLPR